MLGDMPQHPWPEHEGRKMAKTYVYSIARLGFPVCKIGMTSNIKSRLSSLQTGSAERLIVVFESAPMSRLMAACVEKSCHHLLEPASMSGEWFSVSHDTSRMVVESVIDLAFGGYCEHDFHSLVDQTKYQLHESCLL